MHRGFDFTEEMEKKIRDYLDKNLLSIEQFMNEAWLNTTTFFNLKRRGRISVYTLKKFQKVGLDLLKEDEVSNVANSPW